MHFGRKKNLVSLVRRRIVPADCDFSFKVNAPRGLVWSTDRGERPLSIRRFGRHKTSSTASRSKSWWILFRRKRQKSNIKFGMKNSDFLPYSIAPENCDPSSAIIFSLPTYFWSANDQKRAREDFTPSSSCWKTSHFDSASRFLKFSLQICLQKWKKMIRKKD